MIAMKGNFNYNLSPVLLAAILCASSAVLAVGQGADGRSSQKGAGRPTPTPGAVQPAPVRVVRRRRERLSGPRQGGGVSLISVLIVSTQPYSDVWIDNKQQKPTDDKGELEVPLRPGVYQIRVNKNGYIGVVKEVEVSALGAYQQDVEFTQEAAPLRVRVKTEPGEVEVYLDNAFRGRSDADGVLFIEPVLPNTPHTLRGMKDGLITASGELAVNEKEGTLKLSPAFVRQKVKTTPGEVEVYLDGGFKGRSDAEGVLFIERLPVNKSYTMRAFKHGYEAKLQPMVANGEEAAVELAKPPVDVGFDDLRQLVAKEDLAKALGLYERLVSQKPDDPALQRVLDDILQRLRTRSSTVLARTGPYGLTIETEEAKQLSELFQSARRWRGDPVIEGLTQYWGAKYWEAVARETASENEKREALINLRGAARKVGALIPRDPFLIFDLGSIFMSLKDTGMALKYFTDAQSLNPNWAPPLLALAQLDLSAGDKETAKGAKKVHYDRAIARLSQAMSLKPDMPRVRELLSLSYSAANRHIEAIEKGREAVNVRPNSAYAHYILGEAYYQLGVHKDKDEYRNAIAEFNVALTLAEDPLDTLTRNAVQEKIASMKKALRIKH